MINSTYAENSDSLYMYSRVNGNGRDALRMHHEQFPDPPTPEHRLCQWLHRQLRETGSCLVFVSPRHLPPYISMQ
ncbi:hypothetical protein TNCV_710111 [Trichonephila clavipes]|nr:hypothetical protein TNCV_710111 [Trichonephila clavipes]